MGLGREVWIQGPSQVLPEPLGLLKILKVKLKPSQYWHDVQKGALLLQVGVQIGSAFLEGS